MSEYVPTPGPLEGEQYEPGSGTEGGCFIDAWCSNCERDKVMNGTATQDEADVDDSLYCQILNASFRGEAVEWRELPDGSTKCIAWVPMGQPLTQPRCDHTIDLFAT